MKIRIAPHIGNITAQILDDNGEPSLSQTYYIERDSIYFYDNHGNVTKILFNNTMSFTIDAKVSNVSKRRFKRNFDGNNKVFIIKRPKQSRYTLSYYDIYIPSDSVNLSVTDLDDFNIKYITYKRKRVTFDGCDLSYKDKKYVRPTFSQDYFDDRIKSVEENRLQLDVIYGTEFNKEYNEINAMLEEINSTCNVNLALHDLESILKRYELRKREV